MSPEDRLFAAVHAGDAAVVTTLAAKHAPLLRRGWPGGGGASYLHLAAHRGHLAVCQALVEAGDDLDGLRPPDGAVPLHLAAAAGHGAVVRWLLARGAAVDGGIRSWGTPLMAAAMEGHAPVLEALLDAGAEVNREHLRLPQTALDFAELYRVKRNGQERTAALLRAAGGVRLSGPASDGGHHPDGAALVRWERAMNTRVNPLPLAQAEGRLPAVYRCRLPKTFRHQLVFTVGGEGDAVAMCLPSEWPFCERSRVRPEWRWPIDAVREVATAPPHGTVAGSGRPGEPSVWWVLSRFIDGGKGLVARVLVPRPVGKTATPARLLDARWERLALPMPNEGASARRSADQPALTTPARPTTRAR